ncbi:MAG: Type 1 glutamine amidotransferase-like domain-containing protein [Bacteroidales bacterium]|nr:Type 1 glutamine amidotransferase-like domain-containing protein [Bacteroidales bacterium]
MDKWKHLVFFLLACMFTPAFQLAAQDFYHTGSEEPVETSHLPGLVLAGGATDNADAMRWMLERANGGDVVVLRASGSDGYNNYFYTQLGVDVNSVTSIVITSASEANNPAVIEAINNAEVVFIAGGNQWNYVNDWRGTELLEALNTLINDKKITIGGTSAGMAVLGEVVFTAENGTVWSSEALGNPYHWRVTLEKGFLDVPYMQHTVTDSHYNRIQGDDMDRKGRHVAFMARMITDWDMPAKGIAANEYTAIAVDEEGKARVFGHPSYPDYGYFLQTHKGVPELCEEGLPLNWYQDRQALLVYKLKGDFEGSGWFDLNHWNEGEGGEWKYWYVEEGELFETDSGDDTSNTLLSEDDWIVYPNPAILSVNVHATEHLREVAIFDTKGNRLVHVKPDSTHCRIDLGHLPDGIYVLQARSDGNMFTTILKRIRP